MTLPRGRAWLVAIVATLGMTVSYVDRQVLAAIGASVRAALGFDAEQFGWLASAFSAAYLIAAPLAGAAIDRVGARRGLPAAVVTWSLVSAAHALAPSFGVLLALRMALGVAEAPSFPAAAQSVRRALAPGDRSAAFGLLFTGSSLGAAVAGPLAIALDVAFGYKAAFVLASLFGTAWVPLWLLTTRAPSVRAALGPPAPDPDAVVAPTRASLARSPAVLRAVTLMLASAPALMFVFLWLPQYLEFGRHVAKSSLARYVWLPPVMADAGMVGFGVLASRLDRKHATLRSHAGLVLAAALFESSMVLAPRAPETWVAVAVIGISAAGGGGLYTLLTADLMARVHPAQVSTAGGLTAAAQSLTYIVLSPLVGHWIDRSRSFDGPLVLLGAVSLPGAIVWIAWQKRIS